MACLSELVCECIGGVYLGCVFGVCIWGVYWGVCIGVYVLVCL